MLTKRNCQHIFKCFEMSFWPKFFWRSLIFCSRGGDRFLDARGGASPPPRRPCVIPPQREIWSMAWRIPPQRKFRVGDEEGRHWAKSKRELALTLRSWPQISPTTTTTTLTVLWPVGFAAGKNTQGVSKIFVCLQSTRLKTGRGKIFVHKSHLLVRWYSPPPVPPPLFPTQSLTFPPLFFLCCRRENRSWSILPFSSSFSSLSLSVRGNSQLRLSPSFFPVGGDQEMHTYVHGWCYVK